MKVWLVYACLLAFPAFAQQTGSIEGRVTNSQTGDGVSGATVHLTPLGPAETAGTNRPETAHSNADGSFRFDNVPQGFYFVLAECSGYSILRAKSPKSFTVDPGQQMSDLAIQLDPDGRVTGKVVDDEGNAIAGADIEALSTYRFRGKNGLRRSAIGQTDQNGIFVLKDISPGRYYFAASPHAQKQKDKPGGSLNNPEKFDLARTYFPQALDLESATLMDVAAGQSLTDLTIRMARAPTYHVRGHVEGLQLKGQGEGPQIWLGPRESADSANLGHTATLAADGTFDIGNVQAGAYTLRMTGTDPETTATQGARNTRGSRLLAQADLQVGTSDVYGLVLAVLPPGALTGRVTVENSNGATFTLAQTRVTMTSLEMGTFRSYSSSIINADGTFAMPSFDPGRYYVHAANVPRGTYVKAITFNRQDLGNGLLDASQGGTGILDVILRQGVAEVDGMVAADSASSTATNNTVILVPDNVAPDGTGVLFSNAASGKSFVVQNVPPGRYHAFAVVRWDPLLWQDADFLHALTREGVAVEVEENGHAQIELPVTTADQVQEIATRYGINPQQ